MKRVTIAMCVFAVLCVMSTAAQGAQTFESYEIKFQPKPGKGELEVTSGDKNCAKGVGARKGCVNFEEDDFGLITFSIHNQVRYCTDSGTQWVISKIELSPEGYYLAGGTISDKGIFPSLSTMPPWLKSAFPQVNDNGVLYKVANPQDGSTQVTAINLNNNDPDDGTKDIWYRVEVTKCGSDEVLVSDPRFENEGTKN